jgi:hypothetical protein
LTGALSVWACGFFLFALKHPIFVVSERKLSILLPDADKPIIANREFLGLQVMLFPMQVTIFPWLNIVAIFSAGTNDGESIFLCMY